jgi:hypothetical protein
MNPFTERTAYENRGPVVGDRVVERSERREMFMRYILPLLMCLLTFALGYSLGWNSGRNDLLENTYVGERGGMIHNGATDGVVGPSPSDTVGR